MDKRTLLAIVLSVLVVTIWSAFFTPRPQPRRASPAPASPGGPSQEGAAAPAPEPAAERAEPAPAPVAGEAEREFIVETETVSVRFSNRGARVVSWRLLRYVDDRKVPHEMVPRGLKAVEEYPLRVSVPDEAVTRLLDAAVYREDAREAGSGGDDAWLGPGFRGRVATFTYSDGRGLAVTKTIALPAAGYAGRVRVEVSRDGRPAEFDLTWAVGLPEAGGDGTSRIWHVEGQGVAYLGGAFPERVKPAKGSSPRSYPEPGRPARLLWGGVESTYFASLLLPDDPAAARMSLVPAGAIPVEGKDEKLPLLAARFSGAGAGAATVMVGPKDYELLRGLGRNLDLAIDFSGWQIIYYITKYLFLALKWLSGYVGNYGLSIIVLTVLIRAAFFPLIYPSAITMRQNMKKMQRVQPRVKAIQERYRERHRKTKRTVQSQREMNEEIMAIYRKEGINPMGSLGGCLPLLLQMPFFIAFYNLLSVTIELRGAPFFLWIQDLSRMDPYYIWPVLMGASWMVQQWMTGSSIPDPVQRRMMNIMPVMFTFMMLNMPSGLVVYWFFSNVIGLAQQALINRRADREPAEAR
jgi:YidC/Oxa1 family membrane protein insertase